MLYTLKMHIIISITTKIIQNCKLVRWDEMMKLLIQQNKDKLINRNMELAEEI